MKLGVFYFSLMVLTVVSSCTSSSPRSQPLTEEEQQVLQEGEKVYRVHCRPCHMPNGKSPIKRLRFADEEWGNGDSLEDVQKVIREGVAATQMRPFREKLSAEEIDCVSRYVKSLSTDSTP